MVEIIQRRDLSATAGTGSSILSADIMARLFIAVLNPIFHSQRPISLKKNSFAKNQRG